MKKRSIFQSKRKVVGFASVVSFAVILLVGSAVTGSMAQIVRTKPPVVSATPPVVTKPVLIKSAGLIKPPFATPDKASEAPPTPPTSAEKSIILTAAMRESGLVVAPVTPAPYLKLSPRQNYVEMRGFINFLNSALFGPYQNYVIFDGEEKSTVQVAFKPQRIGQWFLIDCSINGKSKNVLDDKFRIYDGKGQFSGEMSVVGTGNLQVIVVSQTQDYLGMSIERLHGEWIFYSCEITTPN